MVMPGQNATQTSAGTSSELLEYMRLHPYLNSTRTSSMYPQQHCSAHIHTFAAADQEPNNPFEKSTTSGQERCSSPSEMTKAHEHAVMGGT